MRIHIESLEISCIIGLLDFEREAEQKVVLDIEIDYIYTEDLFLDYSKIVEKIETHLKKEKYLLLEDALLGTKVLLFKYFTSIERLKLKIAKPDILSQCSLALSDEWSNKPL